MKSSLRNWQLAGFLFTSVAGTLLHFAYDWSGQDLFVGLFSAVNESIWEHMKLLFFPMLLFALMEYRCLGQKFQAFWCAKLAGISLGLTLIPVLYYTYTGISGQMLDWINIAIFFVSAAAVFLLETWLLEKDKLFCKHPVVLQFFLWLLALVFVYFTFFPPQIPLFEDPQTVKTGLWNWLPLK